MTTRPARSPVRARCLATCLLVMLLLWPAGASADTRFDLAAKISQAQQAARELASRRHGQQAVVDSLRGATGGYVAALRQVDQDLLAAVSRLRQAEADLAGVEAETQVLEAQIAEKQSAVEQRARVYSTRVRALYKFTRTSPLEQLLAARDFSDAMRRLTMMQAVTRVDNLLLGQLRAEHAELLTTRDALRQKRAQAAALRDEIDQQRQLLVVRRTRQAALLAQAQQEQSQAEASLSDLDQQASALSAKIAVWQAQHQRELEELERQRVLEEQRRVEEARLLEERRRASAQATAVAQAAARAQPNVSGNAAVSASGAAAQARAPAGGGKPSGAGLVPGPVPTALPLPGSIQTSALQPSAAGLIWPVANPVITTEFGERSFAQLFHTGIDLAQTLYAPVLAAADGIVMERGLAVSGKPSQSYGMVVTIAHGKTLSTLYAHLDDRSRQPPVHAGERVKRGQIIGYIGMTGVTSGPHLHFEVRVSGDYKNPRHYLPK